MDKKEVTMRSFGAVTETAIGITAGLDGIMIGHIFSRQNPVQDFIYANGISANTVVIVAGVSALAAGVYIGDRLLHPGSDQ